MDDLTARLGRLGLSIYEAKALVALLRCSPADGYRVARHASVPTAKVYSVLSRLVNKGLVHAERGAQTGLYRSLPAHAITARLREEYGATIDKLESDLDAASGSAELDPSWGLVGTEVVLRRISEMLRQASRVAYLSLWQSEYGKLARDIRAFRARGVKVVVALFGTTQSREAFTVPMGDCGRSSRRRLRSRLTVAVRDTAEAVICETGRDGKIRGIWSGTREVAVAAAEYTRHDVWGRKLIDVMGEPRFRSLCNEDELMRFLVRSP